MDSRYYPGVEADVQKLIIELRNLFDEDYEVQTMQVSATSVLQARKSGTLRDLTGLSAALTIKITPEAGGTRVEIGMQKWFDKAAIAALALLLSAGLLLALPALGAYWQYKITEDAWKVIEDHIARKAGGYVTAFARPLWNLRGGEQRRLRFLLCVRRQSASGPHLLRVRGHSKREFRSILQSLRQAASVKLGRRSGCTLGHVHSGMLHSAIDLVIDWSYNQRQAR